MEEITNMRKSIYVCLMAVLIAPSVWLGVTDASGQIQELQQENGWGLPQSGPIALPDFDAREVRHKERGWSAQREQLLARRIDSIESFRSEMASEVRPMRRYELHRTGVPKTLFNYEAPLTKKRAGSPDKIARGFLSERADVFGLSPGEVSRLLLGNEDNDQGTTFLSYEQTV